VGTVVIGNFEFGAGDIAVANINPASDQIGSVDFQF